MAGLLSGTAANANITFQFNYLDAAGSGFNDAADGATRRATLEDAASKFSSMFGTHFSNSGTVMMDVTSTNNPASSALASAGSEGYLGTSAPGFNMNDVIRYKLQTGTDLNGSMADGVVNVNFANTWDYSYGTGTSSSGYDFYSVVYHELTHAVGFSSGISGTPNSNGFYDPVGTGVNWGVFDQFITDKDGNRVINPSTYLINEALWSDIKTRSIQADGEQGIYFSGSFAMAANGGKAVPIYSNNPWEDGSSGSHVADFAPYDGMLMRYATGPGDGPLDLSAVEVGMLRDIGYTAAAAVPEPETYAMMLVGLGALAGIGRRRKH